MVMVERVGAILAVAALVGLLWGLVVLIKEAREIDGRERAIWADAVVVRICRDGSRIWQLKDGRYMVGSNQVKDVATVCGAERW